jgi:hypothetical protein
VDYRCGLLSGVSTGSFLRVPIRYDPESSVVSRFFQTHPVEWAKYVHC